MPSPARGPRARIVAVSDVYSLENLPRLRSLVAHHAETDPADAFLVTMGGDFVAPSMLSSLDSGLGMVACMNEVGITHAILGNHEDDIPILELRKRVGELRATLLGTNLVGFTPPLPRNQIVEVRSGGGRSVRLGLVGVVMDDPTAYRHMPFGGIHVSPPNQAAQDEARRLVDDDGCACVVALTHQPLELDRQLAAAQRSPPFPVILGGHEHAPSLERIADTWVAKAGTEAQHAIVVELQWPPTRPDDGADLPAVEVRLEDVAGYPEAPELRAQVDAHMARLGELEAATLVHLGPGERLSSVGTRVKQTSMGTLVCSRIRDALGAQACLFNGGGIRGARDYERHVAYADLKAEVPFDNEIVVARLPGSVVREAVLASRARAPAESGGFLQVDDGVRLTPSHEVTEIGGAPLLADRIYRVAIVRDLFGGLDHIEPLVRFAREHPESVPPAGSGRDVKIVLVDAFSLALYRQLGGFDAVDTNHDGVLSEPELEAAVARVTSEAPSPVVASLLVHALDADHDQRVSRQDVAHAEEAREVAPPIAAAGSSARSRPPTEES